MNDLIVSSHSGKVVPSSTYEKIVELALATVGEKSKRTYSDCYTQFARFSLEHGSNQETLNPLEIMAFVHSGNYTQSTRKHRKAMMLSLLKVATMLEPAYQPNLSMLMLLKVQKTEAKGTPTGRQKLSAGQVENVFANVTGKGAKLLRDKALLSVLFYSGLRREELRLLKWEDIDLEARTIAVRGGKGRDENETEYAPILSQEAVDSIAAWKDVSDGREWFVCPVMKSGRIGADKPINVKPLYELCKALGFAPHAARRTLITSGLASGSSVADMKKVARHKNESTTLAYAEVESVKDAAARIKLGY